MGTLTQFTQGTTVTLGAVPKKTIDNLPIVQLGNVTGNPFVIDTTLGSRFFGTLTGAANLAIEGLFTGTTEPRAVIIQLQQNNPGGGHAVTWSGAGGATVTGVSAGLLVMPHPEGAIASFSVRGTTPGNAIVTNQESPSGTIP